MHHSDDSAQLTLPEIERPSEAADTAASGHSSPDEGREELLRRAQRAEDRWKRTAADLENQRRRDGRDRERLLAAQKETVLREWLDVVDNMERALQNRSEERHPWEQGIEAIHQQMMDMLSRHEVTPMRCNGERFDPHRHEAMGTMRDASLRDGIVAEVLQTGYTIEDRVLRAAKVVIVKND